METAEDAAGFWKDHGRENKEQENRGAGLEGHCWGFGRGKLQSPDMETPSYREPGPKTRGPWTDSQKKERL